MAHQISPDSQSSIVICRILGELTQDDMTCAQELGLNDGKVHYVLLDVSQMTGGLPSDFLEGAKLSWFMHPNLEHLALYAESGLLRSVGTMVAKLTRRQDKLSTHMTFEAALQHLKQLSR